MLSPEPAINGHPAVELETNSDPIVLTVCCECGQLRTVLWLDENRWYCRTCRAEGAKPPNLYPVA